MDILLQKFFEKERWEKAIDIGVGKHIDKGELRKLTCPETRVRLYKAIVSDNYEIAPPHIAMIPKDTPGEFREVYINENIDRIFLSIVNDMFFEMFPDMIHKNCVSYQKGIGCGKVVQGVVREIVKAPNMEIGTKNDLSKYFDTVPLIYIDKVFNTIEKRVGKSKIIDICRKYYHMHLYFDTEGNLCERYQSLKQGCALASFLADVVLYDIDNVISQLDVMYVRYSDDLLIVGNDWKIGQAMLKDMLTNMGLMLNPKKVEVLRKDKWFKFLGFNIKGDQITLSKSRVKSFQKEIETRTINHKRISPTKAVNQVNSYLYKGDGTYSWSTSVLPIINVQKDIDVLNEFVLDCLRATQTQKKKIGGLGVVVDRDDYTILRGTGRNVSSNKNKTAKEIEGYLSLRCMQNALLTNRAVYETLVRGL